MKNSSIYLLSLIISIVVSLFGAAFKVLHLAGASPVLIAGILFSLIYIFIGLYNVFTNQRIIVAEKIMWLVGFLFLSWITGIIYYVRCRSVKSN